MGVQRLMCLYLQRIDQSGHSLIGGIDRYHRPRPLNNFVPLNFLVPLTCRLITSFQIDTFPVIRLRIVEKSVVYVGYLDAVSAG